MMNQEETTTANASAASRHAGSFSILAGFALALAVIPCCPMVSLLGGVLGVIALQRIKLSGGRLRGKRAAAAAVIVGCSLSLASTIALNSIGNRISEANNKAMSQAIVRVIESSAADRPNEVRQQFAREVQIALRDVEIQAFGSQIRENYGRFQRFAIASTSERGVFSRKVDVAGVFVFDRVERLGSVSFDMAVTIDQTWPRFQLRSITIEDADLGHAQLPPKPHSATQPRP